MWVDIILMTFYLCGIHLYMNIRTPPGLLSTYWQKSKQEWGWVVLVLLYLYVRIINLRILGAS